MGNAVTHFEIVGADAELLQSFYRDAFGWEMQPAVPGYAMAPDDPAADLARIVSLGGTTVLPPTPIPGGPTIALLADPEGHVIGLAKRPDT